MFMRVNSKCAHQVRPPLNGNDEPGCPHILGRQNAWVPRAILTRLAKIFTVCSLRASSSAPSRVAGGLLVRNAGLGKQSSRGCLRADARGPPPSGDGERQLGTIHGVDEAGSERPMKRRR